MLNQETVKLLTKCGAHVTTENLASNPIQYRNYIEIHDRNIEALIDAIITECANAAAITSRSFSDGDAALGSAAAERAVSSIRSKYLRS